MFAFSCRSCSAAARAEGRVLCGVSVLNTRGVRGPAPSQARGIFHARRGCAGPLICACTERRLRARTLHLCMPAVSAQARTFHLPVGEVAVLLGTTWHQACCQSSGGIRWLILVPNILVPLFFLVQNFLRKKRSMLRSIPKGS